VIPKPWQKPHPPIYQVCGSEDGIESSAARGWPMLNSLLTGPVDQLVNRRNSYLTALRKHGRTEVEITALMKNWGVSRQIYVAATDAQALAEAKDAEMWYQDSLQRFQVPERIEDAHPSLQPGFRAAAERFKKVTWEKLVEETVAFGSPETVTRHIAHMRELGIGHILCWMNFGGLPQDKIRRSMELFATEVMPHFRDR
jgi:alkanesulfonate monooxygenase SsuD/methylene tetrahydromethanopterin reductase-like flavin-dependent oxidoreductase (luciferase family)